MAWLVPTWLVPGLVCGVSAGVEGSDVSAEFDEADRGDDDETVDAERHEVG